MKRIRVLYLGSYASSIAYDSTFKLDMRTGQQLQKFGRLFSESLIHHDIEVEVLCKMPINKQNYSKAFFYRKKEKINMITFNYHLVFNIPIIKSLLLIPSTFFYLILRLILSKNTIVICDPMNTIHFTISRIVTSIFRRRLVAVVTDVPMHYIGYLNTKIPFSMKFISKIMKNADGYILVTEQMNKLVNPQSRPFVVIEGFSDYRLANKRNLLSNKTKPSICLYAGGVVKEYGLKNLIEAFVNCKSDNWELHIYGGGKFANELEKICSIHKNVKYFGVKDNSYIIEREYEARILINPRITEFEYTKYSFPSKNMEYMSTGTPVLTTKLPGMPSEYLDFVYTFSGESVEKMTETLNEILRIPPKQLHMFGGKAKKWIETNKNNNVQGEKIKLLLIELLGIKKG